MNKLFIIFIMISGILLTNCVLEKEKPIVNYSEAIFLKASEEVEGFILSNQLRGVPGSLTRNIYTNDYYKDILSTNISQSYIISTYKILNNQKDIVDLLLDKNTNISWFLNDNGINASIYLYLNLYGPFTNSRFKIARKDGAPWRMGFWNGNAQDYYNYGRIKTLDIEIYETGILHTRTDVDPEFNHGVLFMLTNVSYLIYKKEYQLEDKPGWQYLNLDFPDLSKIYREQLQDADGIERKYGGVIDYGGKITRMVFKDIYPGTKYSNTCITEIKFIYE